MPENQPPPPPAQWPANAPAPSATQWPPSAAPGPAPAQWPRNAAPGPAPAQWPPAQAPRPGARWAAPGQPPYPGGYPPPAAQPQPPAYPSAYPPGYPPAYPTAAPQSPPVACPRCYVALHPGYTQCVNCGLDLAAARAMPTSAWAPQVARRKSRLPIALALGGVVLLAISGGLFAIARQSSAHPGATPSGSLPALAVTSPSASTGPIGTDTPAPAETPAATETSPSSAISDWITFSPSGVGFTAMYPGQPKLTSQTSKTPVGNVPVSIWSYVDSTHLMLFAGRGRYPAGSMTGVSPSAVFDGSVSGMATGSAQTLESSADCTRDGYPGRAFVLTGSQVTTKGQIYLVGDDMYMVYAIYDAAGDVSQVDGFLASFHLTRLSRRYSLPGRRKSAPGSGQGVEMADDIVRQQLLELLDGEGAHMPFDAAVADFPGRRNQPPAA